MGGHSPKLYMGLVGKYKLIILSNHFLHFKNLHKAFSLYSIAEFIYSHLFLLVFTFDNLLNNQTDCGNQTVKIVAHFFE